MEVEMKIKLTFNIVDTLNDEIEIIEESHPTLEE